MVDFDVSSQIGSYTYDRPIYSCLNNKFVRFDNVKLKADLENDIDSSVNLNKTLLFNFNVT